MIRYSLAYIWLLGIIGQRKVFVNPFLLDAERCQLKTPTTYSHGDFCYEFYLGTEVYWHDAKTACEHRGGYLATIDSMNVHNFIMDKLKDLGFSHNGIWIGLNDEAEELHWRWADGTPLGSFQYWGTGESNQFLTHFLEDCVHLRYTDGGRWHDSPCDSLKYKYNYICQSNILPTRAATLMRTTASTLRTTTTKATTATITTTQQRTLKLSSTPEHEYTETSASATNMHTSTTRIPRMPTDTSEKVVTSAESTSGTAFQTAPTTTLTDTTTLEKETTTTAGSTSTMKTTTTAKSDKETTTTPMSTSGPITTSAMKTTVKEEKEITMTPISTTSWPITISTVKKTTSTNAKPTTSITMKLTINTAMAHTSTTISRPVTTKTSTTSPTTMKSTMSTATTTKSTTQLTTGREIDPCTGFTCNLDCGILGYVYGENGCPECACAT